MNQPAKKNLAGLTDQEWQTIAEHRSHQKQLADECLACALRDHITCSMCKKGFVPWSLKWIDIFETNKDGVRVRGQGLLCKKCSATAIKQTSL